MGTMRRVVFPILRLIIWAVIAVALCVLAFRQAGPALEQPDDTVTAPGADFTDSVVEVGTQTVTSSVDLKGEIKPVAATEVTAPVGGTAVYFAMPSGRAVEDDQPLMTLRTREPREPVEQVDAEGNLTSTPQSDKVTDSTVYANAAGEITFAVELNKEVAQGDVVASIDPKVNYIAATVPPSSLYQLLALPPSATVTIANGPAPFECVNLTLKTTTADGASTTELRCDIPTDVTVFPGLEVGIEVITATAEDAVVVPLTAVRGTVQAGSVWVVGADGEPVETAVALGLMGDGVVQVTEGLAAGDTILQFVPGTPAEYPDGTQGVDGDNSGGDGSEEVTDDGSGEVTEEPVDDGGESTEEG